MANQWPITRVPEKLKLTSLLWVRSNISEPTVDNSLLFQHTTVVHYEATKRPDQSLTIGDTAEVFEAFDAKLFDFFQLIC